jgi:prevent-host-death family protein
VEQAWTRRGDIPLTGRITIRVMGSRQHQTGQNGQMKTATITEAKNGLRALIDLVRSGESVVITDRGRPVAMLEPMHSPPDPTGRLLRLERAGIVRVGTGVVPIELLRTPPPRLTPGASAVEALLDERRSGR